MTHSIAAASARRIDRLAAIVAPIRQPETPEIDALLRLALEELRAASATVSVVGQVKAGKSSLINALTGLSDLLPTEVNPWTAVITNLHFGHPGKPEAGAVFDLFSEAEWDRMVTGDAETRKLAEELLPGFSSEKLERQIHEMQESARRRLGDQYEELLGKQHQFNAVTPEVLARYVSAGSDEACDARGSSAGRYSGITRSASVFLPAGPFRVPVTVSDTPGINDPFLVRDEITTGSFRAADVFVVAISAHQALGAADVALLKMLAHHRAKKTILYVNRIDEIEDPATALPGILRGLRKRLAEELGAANCTIRAGSAFWGQIAATGTDAEVAAMLDDPAFRSILKAEGGPIDPARQSPREQLYRASGMGELANALGQAIYEGPALAALGTAAAKVQAAVNLSRAQLRRRLADETAAHVVGDDIDAVVRSESARLLQRASTSGAVARELRALSSEGLREVFHSTDVALSSAEESIRLAVETFVAGELAGLRRAGAAGGVQGTWRLDTGRLGETVVETLRRSFDNCRVELDRLLTGYATNLDDVTRGTAAEVRFDGLLDNLPYDQILPAFKPRASVIEVPLVAERGWKFWKSKALSSEAATAKIMAVLKSELEAPLRSAIDGLREAVDARGAAALGRMEGVLRAAMKLVEDEARGLQKEAAELSGGRGRQRIAEIYEHRRARAVAVRAQLAALDEAERALAEAFPEVLLPEELRRPAAERVPVGATA